MVRLAFPGNGENPVGQPGICEGREADGLGVFDDTVTLLLTVT